MGFCRLWSEATRLDHQKIQGRRVDRDNPLAAFKRYEGAKRIPLPSPGAIEIPPADLWGALHGRRSVRRYSDTDLPLYHLAALLWACQGITARQGPYLLRPAPSAGALFPFESYLLVNHVEGLEPGIYHLDVENFALELVREGELAGELVEAALGQRFLARAAAVFIWTTIAERCEWKYGDRATRYIPLDLGHLCQNLCLAATALGLGSCAVGAFLDEQANNFLEVDGDTEQVFYMASVGEPAK